MPFALCQESSPPCPAQFTDEELTRLLDQLNELKACRAIVVAYKELMAQKEEQRKRDAESYQRAIDVEKRLTVVTEKERDAIAKERDFYKEAYEQVTKKKGGVKCFFKKLGTFGIARC